MNVKIHECADAGRAADAARVFPAVRSGMRQISPATVLAAALPGTVRRGASAIQIWDTSDFLKKSKCSRARPVPRATQFSAFSATWQGTPVTLGQQLVDVAQERTAAGHHHALVDDVRASSGGVCSSTERTAVTSCWSGASIASITSELVIGIVRGRPAMRSRPRTSI